VDALAGEGVDEFDGARYPSLSAAGKATAGYPVNGWRFWRPIEQSQE
jgi:hypothetical protein